MHNYYIYLIKIFSISKGCGIVVSFSSISCSIVNKFSHMRTYIFSILQCFFCFLVFVGDKVIKVMSLNRSTA